MHIVWPTFMLDELVKIDIISRAMAKSSYQYFAVPGRGIWRMGRGDGGGKLDAERAVEAS